MQQNSQKQQQIQKELDDMRQKKRQCKILQKIFLQSNFRSLIINQFLKDLQVKQRICEKQMRVLNWNIFQNIQMKRLNNIYFWLRNQNQMLKKRESYLRNIIHNRLYCILIQQSKLTSQRQQMIVSQLKNQPIFVQGIDSLNPSSFASEWNNVIKDYNQKLVQLQQQLESATNEECFRILKYYQNKKLLSDMQELKMVLYALFGQSQGDQQWIHFIVD
ncbi:unnamed protein product (macronuclear) [Paramecium tetraurelia]|uniref:Uncharacterized protein n=1 Tax=Paramecium tetraurelia TaxID=5888 RepID=A0E6X5_PARTE|nr:uncharacterized protein GSPATT00023770001 [Paramecium tetraurelia]CAK91042.1 unnamed protein product [Paramecium tetraurelia]|eukprot:XP_001458439.1 hypothetical protein (macronuclear) [Paramecium tetraurelia strain d4-2]